MQACRPCKIYPFKTLYQLQKKENLLSAHPPTEDLLVYFTLINESM